MQGAFCKLISTEPMNSTNAIKIDPASNWGRSLPHITALLHAGGHVTLGRVEEIDDVAVAANDRKVFATLKRLKDETAADLMQRLDDGLNHAAFAFPTPLYVASCG